MRLRLGGGPGRGITGWSVRGLGELDLDGLDTRASDAPPAAGATHPNGTVSIDHLAVITPDLDRTVGRAPGRRLRPAPPARGGHPGRLAPQAFFRMGELILEVVEAPADTKIAADPSGPARLWGISFGVADLARPGGRARLIAAPRADAVQPGRRIATRREGRARHGRSPS